MSSLECFSRYTLFVLNFIIGCSAITLVGLGIIYFMDEQAGVNTFSNIAAQFPLGIIMVAVGALVLFAVSFGCCGALYMNPKILISYGIILLLISCIEIALGILALLRIINEETFFQDIENLLTDLFNDIKVSANPGFYNLQNQFKCCGIHSSSDYQTAEIPSSCCGRSPCTRPYEIGCAEAFTNAMKNLIEAIAITVLAFAGCELLCAICSFTLRRRLFNQKRVLTPTKPASETSI